MGKRMYHCSVEDMQVVLVIGGPTLAVVIGIVIRYWQVSTIGAKIGDVCARIMELRQDMNARFEDLKEMGRAELRRVEEVLDARLKHLEAR
jgi:hypothetical protein